MKPDVDIESRYLCEREERMLGLVEDHRVLVNDYSGGAAFYIISEQPVGAVSLTSLRDDSLGGQCLRDLISWGLLFFGRGAPEGIKVPDGVRMLFPTILGLEYTNTYTLPYVETLL